MLLKGSRYEKTKRFEFDRDVNFHFRGLRARDIGRAEGVLEHTTSSDERLDLVGLRYFNDTRRWWKVLDANPLILYGGDLFQRDTEGLLILIPRSHEPGER